MSLSNPIIRRYCRARLRPQALMVWLLITVLFSGFCFFMIRAGGMYRGKMLDVDAERLPLTTLLAIQAVILFFLGTGQTAGGITGEADEGVLEYQRLSPMSPLAKVIGYWIGLPIREWLMFACTLPFTAWCLWRGQVPFRAWASVYLIFITSALLYHLTGLTAGMVVRNRRWAFLMSMGIIVMLYTVLPQVSKLGLIFFDYITVWPVLTEQMPHFVPRNVGKVVQIVNQLTPSVKFFNLEFDELVFTLFCQGGVMLTLVTMVWRRWQSVESHLLGKGFALGLFAWMQTLLLGNALPLIDSGKLFLSRRIARSFGNGFPETDPKVEEGITVIGVYGLATMLIALMLTSIITPSIDTQLRGLRRARKLGNTGVPRWSDAATALPVAFAMVVVGAGAWFIFGQTLMESKWFPGHALPWFAALAFALTLINAVLGFHSLKEGWSTRALFVAVICLGIVPPMIGAVLGMISDHLMTWTTWLSAMSPASGPPLAPAVLVPGGDLPTGIARAVPRAFWFWQSISLLAVGWLLVRLRAQHRQRRDQVAGE